MPVKGLTPAEKEAAKQYEKELAEKRGRVAELAQAELAREWKRNRRKKKGDKED